MDFDIFWQKCYR